MATGLPKHIVDQDRRRKEARRQVEAEVPAESGALGGDLRKEAVRRRTDEIYQELGKPAREGLQREFGDLVADLVRRMAERGNPGTEKLQGFPKRRVKGWRVYYKHDSVARLSVTVDGKVSTRLGAKGPRWVDPLDGRAQRPANQRDQESFRQALVSLLS